MCNRMCCLLPLKLADEVWRGMGVTSGGVGGSAALELGGAWIQARTDCEHGSCVSFPCQVLAPTRPVDEQNGEYLPRRGGKMTIGMWQQTRVESNSVLWKG